MRVHACVAVALFGLSVANAEKKFSLALNRELSCGRPPKLNGEDLQELIAKSKGALVIANPEMRCTKAAKAALNSKDIKYEEHEFTTQFGYTPGASAVWDWLHCTYPDDKAG